MRNIMFCVILLIGVLFLGCSGNPVSPNENLEVTDSYGNAAQQNTHLWGYFDVCIDIENQTAEAVLNRSATFAANVVDFVNNPVTNLGFDIHDIPIGSGYIDIDIDVSISHPFPGMDQYNGYDVRGIFMGEGSGTMIYEGLNFPEYGSDQVMYDYDETESDPYDGLVGMPDGYTRWFNADEFETSGLFGYTQGALATPGYIDDLDSNLNPYKYFADGLDVEDNLWTFLSGTSDNGVFSAGETNTRNYYLRFPTPNPNVKYGYAIVANWEAEDVHPSNAVEAVAVSVADNSDVYFVSGTEKGGNMILDVELFGWNVQPAVVKIESTVLSAVEEMTAVPGSDPSTYTIDVPADAVGGLVGNEYWVIAEYEGFDYTCEFSPPNSAPTDTLAAFFRFDLAVSNEAPPPPPEGIIPWDEGPNAAFETAMTSSGGGVSAIDIGIRPNDGGVYLLWTAAIASHARAQRYNPDLTDEGSELDLFDDGQGIFDESNIVFGNSFLDCNEHEDEIALGIIIGPYYVFEVNEDLEYVPVALQNPIIAGGFFGGGWGVIDAANTYDGNVSSYALAEVFGHCNRYRYLSEPGQNNNAYNGMEDPTSTNFDEWYQWPTDPPESYEKKCIAIGIGNDASAVWALFTEADYVRRYTTDDDPFVSDLTMTAYADTAPISFGNTGTTDGNFTNPCDISLRQSDNRIYVVDQPGNELRIQAFENSTGNFLGASEVIDIPDGVSVYRMDHNDHDGLIYVLLSNNMIRVFCDFI